MKAFNPFLVFCVFSFVFFSCQNKEIYQPIQSTNNTQFITKSVELSKKRQEDEKKTIKKWMAIQDSLQGIKFQQTSAGFWIHFIKQNNNPKAKENDYVDYTAQIKTLDNKLIYDFTEFGNKKVYLGKTHEIRGIDSALRMMGKADEVVLLLPSFVAYGVYGDEKKIGFNVPILVELKLNDVKPSTKQKK